MITPTGYDTKLTNAIQQVLISTAGSVVYIDGEYFFAFEFFPAEGSKEYTTLVGFPITSKLVEFVPTQEAGVTKMPVTHDYIEKTPLVKQQFHKNQLYRWFQNVRTK